MNSYATALLLLMASTLTCWSFRLPGIDLAPPIVVAAILWGIVLFSWLQSALSVKAKQASIALAISKLTAVPVIAIGVFGLSYVGVPRYIAFEYSKSELTHFVKQYSADLPGTNYEVDTWVGVYHITRVELIKEGVRLRLTGSQSGVFRLGLAFLPNGRSPSQNGAWEEYEVIEGQWYVWRMLAI